jgi:hypothetical protein
MATTRHIHHLDPNHQRVFTLFDTTGDLPLTGRQGQMRRAGDWDGASR